MRNKIIILLGLTFIIFGFNRKDDSFSKVSINRVEYDSILHKWKKDSLGCLKIRDLKMCGKIIKKYNLFDKDTLQVRETLGKPNRYISKKHWIYYTHIECDSDRYIIDSLDKSWVQLSFTDNFKLKKFYFGCN